VIALEFHSEALAEFESAVRHYEQQRTGLGSRFTAAEEAAIASGFKLIPLTGKN
jgi:hypothetical protein